MAEVIGISTPFNGSYLYDAINGKLDLTQENVVKIEDDTKIQIGDFEINAKDLGRLLKKFAKENMPEVLV